MAHQNNDFFLMVLKEICSTIFVHFVFNHSKVPWIGESSVNELPGCGLSQYLYAELFYLQFVYSHKSSHFAGHFDFFSPLISLSKTK